MIVAVVLAGGRSRRFGSEKAMALFKGEPMLAHAVGRLTAQGLPVAINAPGESRAAAWALEHALPVVNDGASDPSGPLAGLMAGLRWAKGQDAKVLATTPCDTPRAPTTLEGMLAAALTEGAGAAVARSPSGVQSLCAVWNVEAASAVLAAHFAEGRHPAVHDLLAQLSAVEVLFPDDAPFANLNTQDDVERAQR